ncbi:MAG TPA: SRPBCC domain-containing protein [Ignavibacteria bacterium]|nr:SRPBCC domain-containing protein [Ignavibacteria bacterium]
MENKPVTAEQLFNSDTKKIWNALTDKNEMKKWYFYLEEFKAKTGFKFQFYGGPDPENQFLHLCEVLEVIPEKKLSYSWRYDGYPGNSTVTFELIKEEDKTLLKLSHKGLETFPADNENFAFKNFEKGWDEIIHTSLKQYIEKPN